MSRPRQATVVEVRPVRADDGSFFLTHCAWIAKDSAGRSFGGDTEAEARTMAEQYNAPHRARNNKEA